jgi:hypothetical protein
MIAADGRSIMLALLAWLDGSDGEENARRIAEYVIERAIGGHFGFFKLLLDLVDGRLHRPSEEETTLDGELSLDVRVESRGRIVAGYRARQFSDRISGQSALGLSESQ